jgi:hypothetical protein
MTGRVEIVRKGQFTGVRFWLELPVTVLRQGQTEQVQGKFLHGPGDDDTAAVTFWGKAQLKVVLKKALDLLERDGEKSIAERAAE